MKQANNNLWDEAGLTDLKFHGPTNEAQLILNKNIVIIFALLKFIYYPQQLILI